MPISQLPDGFVANVKQELRTRRESASGRRLERCECVAPRLPVKHNVAGVLPDRAFRAALPVEPRLWKDPRGLAHEAGAFLAREDGVTMEESP